MVAAKGFMPASMWRAMFSMTTNGVVHDEASRDRERHEGKVVEAIAAEIHHTERAYEGKRNSDAGNDRGPDVTEKNEDDENHERDGDQKRDFDVVNRSANRRGAIHGDAEMERRRDGSAELRHERLDAVHGFDHVGAGLAKNGQDDARLAEGRPRFAKIFDGIVTVAMSLRRTGAPTWPATMSGSYS